MKLARSLCLAIARLLNAPVDLFAGLGFVAVFSGAANVPLAWSRRSTIAGLPIVAA